MALYDDFLAGKLGDEDKLLKKSLSGELFASDFLSATPAERQRYLTHNQFTERGVAPDVAAGHALRSVTQGPFDNSSLTAGQMSQALSGLDPAFARAAAAQLGGLVTAEQQHKSSGLLGAVGSVMNPVTDFLSEHQDMFVPAVGAALFGGVGALGSSAGAAGAESASGGGTIAGGSASGTGLSGGSLGSGLTVGSSASGLGGGSLGTGLTAGTTTGGIGGGALGSGVAAGGSLAGAGALAPGYFAAESLYPVMGGSTMAGIGGASGGATGGAASSALGGLGSSLLSNPGLIGAGLGALAGGLGGAKQAGETTSTTAPWGPLQPYLTSLFPGAAQTASDTMSGKYLTPQSNPYLAQYGQFLSDQIGANVDSRFSAAGRYGSGGHAGEVARQVGGTLSGLYGNAYSQERGLQNQTANGLLGGNYGGTKTEPYFQNKVGDMFSGALTGYGLSKMFS